jgi:UPF0755 protein
VSEYGNGWSQRPRPPQGPRGFQDPRLAQDPRLRQDPRRAQDPRLAQDPRRGLPGQPGRPPEDPLSLLPPEYEPVHHEPRPDQRRPDDSPWRRTQRLPQSEATTWRPGQPVRASHGEDPRALGGEEHQGHYPDEGFYEDGYGSPGRFVPGFGADDDEEDDGGWSDRGGRAGRRGAGRGGPGRGPTQKAARPGGGRPPGPRRRRFRWIAPLAALLVIVVPLAIGGAYAYSLYQSKYHPADYPGAGAGSVVVQVPSGASASSLGPELVKLGVVASSRAFVIAAEHSSNPNGLLPGFYGMRKQMKASLAYATLLNPKDLVQITVTIPEGWRLSQTVGWLGVHSGIPLAAYEKVLKDPASLHLPAYAKGKPEGYLFPATYEILPHETALGVLTGMVQRFDQQASLVNLTAAASKVHLTPDQVITMASLVQAEGGRLSDYPKIARVIYNRLAQGIPLQLDSTVLYGLNTYGILASDQQLTSTSPYNTYKYKGLTPGPIDNPGNAAIQAVLHPASANWLYFVTVNPKTGETEFTASQAQFEQFRQELEKNLGQG